MNSYTVIVVGARGSGKTVFLGSMYRKLSVAGEYGFYLEAKGQQQRQLNQIYNSVATGEEWPDATKMADIDHWKFNCRVISPGSKIYTAFEINYLDYSGGRITDADEDDPQFDGWLEKADCLLGLLDGQKIYDYMRGVDKGGRFQNIEMTNIFQILNRSTNPIHFVISKWDLINGHYRLEDIRDKLLQFDLFANLVQTRNRLGSPVRLIPVSSIGNGFAVREPDGRMKKNPGASPNPFQVEMPLALVLPDKVQTELQRILRKKTDVNNTQIRVERTLSLWDKLGRAFGGTVRFVREYLPDKLQYTEKLLKKIAERSEQGARSKELSAQRTEQERRRELDASLALVKDEETALEHAINSFLNIEKKLNFAFPASRIELP